MLQLHVRSIRQTDRMAGSSVTFQQVTKVLVSVQVSKKTSSGEKNQQPRTSVFDRLGVFHRASINPEDYHPRHSVLSCSPFRQGSPESFLPRFSKGRPKELPLLQRPADVAGGGLAWLCPVVAKLAGDLPGHQHCRGGGGSDLCSSTSTHPHSITFHSRNSRQDLLQAVDALLSKGAIERVLNESFLGFYSQLFLLLKKTGDLRPVIDLSTLNWHLVMPHFKMETQASIRATIRSQEWTVSIDIRDAISMSRRTGPSNSTCNSE